MYTWFKRRRVVKQATELLRTARHVQHMREDLLADQQLEEFKKAQQDVAVALKTKPRDHEHLRRAGEALDHVLHDVSAKHSHQALRENLEIVVVAVAVAMAFRTYFIQPFKIPTGSMQPTLYGITSVETERTLFDRLPLSVVRWIVFGDRYQTIRAQTSGYLTDAIEFRSQTPSFCLIGRQQHKIPRGARLRFRSGDFVRKDEVLWAGRVTAGDHVFVNKMIWNFRRPQRGEVIVFHTENIPELPAGTHYIKRLIGMPNETVAIDPPHVLINQTRLDQPDTIRHITDSMGYQLLGPHVRQGVLRMHGDHFDLKPDEYFAFGDNTGNSKDSRYWGAVPAANLVGPAVVVYWPFSGRWGWIR